METVLNWEGPYKPARFIADVKLRAQFECPGVYLWIENYGGGIRLSYVGRATGKPTLARRQMQHYAYMIGGLYTVPKEFRHSQTTWIPDWTNHETADVLLNKERYLELIEDTFRFASASDVYLFRAVNGEDVRAIERNLLYKLRPTGTKWGTLTKPNSEITLTHRAPEELARVMRDQGRHELLFV